jgi:uncharacterized OsmC-like protein
MTLADAPVNNGVALPALLDARTALEADPTLAQFVWKASRRWEHGTHSCTTIERFDGLGGVQSHHTEFGYDVDHPECCAAPDHGPTPVEFVLVGLAGCLPAGIASVAQVRQIQLRSVRATVEADMDVTGVLGMDPTIRNGFGSVAVRYRIDADATPEEIDALVAQSQKRSAVFDVLTDPTTVVVAVER